MVLTKFVDCCNAPQCEHVWRKKKSSSVPFNYPMINYLAAFSSQLTKLSYLHLRQLKLEFSLLRSFNYSEDAMKVKVIVSK